MDSSVEDSGLSRSCFTRCWSTGPRISPFISPLAPVHLTHSEVLWCAKVSGLWNSPFTRARAVISGRTVRMYSCTSLTPRCFRTSASNSLRIEIPVKSTKKFPTACLFEQQDLRNKFATPRQLFVCGDDTNFTMKLKEPLCSEHICQQQKGRRKKVIKCLQFISAGNFTQQSSRRSDWFLRTQWPLSGWKWRTLSQRSCEQVSSSLPVKHVPKVDEVMADHL